MKSSKQVWVVSVLFSVFCIGMLMFSLNYTLTDDVFAVFLLALAGMVLFLRFVFIPKIYTYIRAHKSAWFLIFAGLCISATIFLVSEIRFRNYYNFHDIIVTITALGEKNEDSAATQVWIDQIYIDGAPLTLDELLPTNGWFIEENSMSGRNNLLSLYAQPAEITFPINPTSHLIVGFVHHNWSGFVRIDTGHYSVELDLFGALGYEAIIGHYIPIILDLSGIQSLQRVIFYALMANLIILLVFSAFYSHNFLKDLNNIQNERPLIMLITCLVFLLLVWNVNQHFSLSVLPDEFGYVATAAFLYGYDFSGPISLFYYYSYGFALILFPLFALFDDPILFLRATIIFNSIILSLVFPMAYAFGKRRAPKINNSLLLIISLCVSLFHANIVMARIIWVEAILIVVFWLLCILFSKTHKNSHSVHFVLIAFFLAYIYLLHQRALAVTLAGLLTIVLLKFFNKITRKQLITFFLVFLPITFIHYFYALTFIQQNIWLRTEDLANDYANMVARLMHMFTIEGFLSLFRGFIGQLFSFATATYLLGFIGIAFLAKSVILSTHKILQKRGTDVDVDSFVDIFILISFIISMGVSTLAMIRPVRLDHLVYERYIYYTMGPMLVIALLNMFFLQDKLGIVKRVMVFSMFTYFIASVAFFILILNFSGTLMAFFAPNAIGVSTYIVDGEINIHTAFAVASLISLILYSTLKMKEQYKILAITLVISLFIRDGVGMVNNNILPRSQNHYRAHEDIVQSIREKNNGNDVFFLPDMSVSSLFIQYHLWDIPIAPKRYIYDMPYDYLLLTSSLTNDLVNYYHISSRIPDVFFLRRGIVEPNPPLYSYVFDNDEFFFFTGFSSFEGTSRWSINGRSAIFMHLERSNYIVEINQHFGLPEQLLDEHDLYFEFYFNGNLISVLGNDEIKHSQKIRLYIPDYYVLEGLNKLEIVYDPWSPLEVIDGSTDSRWLGLSISEVMVLRQWNNMFNHEIRHLRPRTMQVINVTRL